MAKKQLRSPQAPSPQFQKWLEEYRRGMHPGLNPSPEHYKSIWDTSYIPDRYTPATPEMIAEAETRLEIVIPASMREQLLIQNGGCLVECDPYLFHDNSVHWTNATVDGIGPVQSWKRAKDDPWFDVVKDVQDLGLLIVIAAHSESQFCLDYRKSGVSGMPCITYVNVTKKPVQIVTIAKSVDEFIQTIVSSRPVNDHA